MRDLEPAVAVDTGADIACVKHGHRHRSGDYRATATLFGTISMTLRIGLVIDLLHLGGAELLITAMFNPIDQRMNI